MITIHSTWHISQIMFILIFFFTHTTTTEIYTLSLHDALPTSGSLVRPSIIARARSRPSAFAPVMRTVPSRSEEHTSELQSLTNIVCRLLLEKKKKQNE